MMDFVINSSIVELTTNPLFLLRLIRVENNTIYSPKHCLSPQFIHFQLTIQRFSKLVKIKGNNGRRMASSNKKFQREQPRLWLMLLISRSIGRGKGYTLKFVLKESVHCLDSLRDCHSYELR